MPTHHSPAERCRRFLALCTDRPGKSIARYAKRLHGRMQRLMTADMHIARHPAHVPPGSIILFPCPENTLCCGLAGIVSFTRALPMPTEPDTGHIGELIADAEQHCLTLCRKAGRNLAREYLGGAQALENLLDAMHALKGDMLFQAIFKSSSLQDELARFAARMEALIASETAALAESMGVLAHQDVDVLAARIEALRDAAWYIAVELPGNIAKIRALSGRSRPDLKAPVITAYKKLNTVLNSLNRLEVRGRDSAGISLLFVLSAEELEKFRNTLADNGLLQRFNKRTEWDVLANNAISVHEDTAAGGTGLAALAFTYKTAAEIGSLGDNVSFLRQQIGDDTLLQTLLTCDILRHTVSAHTRWASVGAISEANCHPVDNETASPQAGRAGIIHACLNGDIDNYLELKKALERGGSPVSEDITTDTKIIPLQVAAYINQGHAVQEAFRLAVNDFKGSHAITMHTDLAPGRLFLAQKGSGQALFIGIADEQYIPTSEVYGFVEETPYFIKMDGEKIVQGKHGDTRGQIFILDQDSPGGIEGITALYYDGTPLVLEKDDIKQTDITSRDIDRQDFPHYFLKEISESPVSVERTLQNRWKIKEDGSGLYTVAPGEQAVPVFLRDELADGRIRRIFFVGQGTAGVAASACADILNYYINDPGLQISSLKSSELSGFKLSAHDDGGMADTLTIAITQSGTTTDTNRTIDMLRERGGRTIAIVNRRDSDITFKVDGVLYTSSGRDIEMSVASTKAFYSQIVAGALLGLSIAHIKGRRSDEFVTEELQQMLALPSQMRTVIAMRSLIEESARKTATSRTYWAAVGSGPNKASADEIRIKLSELCYKTISSDFVEDKKHIDLSSEPMIIVCAAGTRPSVIGDVIKDTAIFHAHKAVPVVIADEGESRFDPYAETVFHVPPVAEHLAPVINTLVGHLWGYYAALTINEGSRFLHNFREDIRTTIDEATGKGLDIYEVILEKSFREKIAGFYNEFRQKKAESRLPSFIGIETAANLILLLKYLIGRLPHYDFELDFKKSGTPLNMLNTLFECLGEAINSMARPIDAIKHQAKTVTVGTSRISEKLEGILFEVLDEHAISVSQLISRNIVVLKNLQEIVAEIRGATLYRVAGLNLLGEPTDDTTIEVVSKRGELSAIPSRVETDNRLQGTKKIIVKEGNVYIGTGRKDGRSMLVIPVIPASSSTPSMVENMLLLHITFKPDIPLATKKKALGGKYDRIRSIVEENSVEWDDRYLEWVEPPALFGNSAEKTGEFIVAVSQQTPDRH